MLINEAAKKTGLTKKAIRYYMNQGLVSPQFSENGYTVFTDDDVLCLEKIRTLRAIGLSTVEIRNVLDDTTSSSMQTILLKNSLKLEQNKNKKKLLAELAETGSYSNIQRKVEVIEQNTTIMEKIIEAFPGYYGRFMCLYFSQYLQETLYNDEQEEACHIILAFLDSVPNWEISAELEAYLEEITAYFGINEITRTIEIQKEAIEDMETYYLENKELLKNYLDYRQSDEYKNSPAAELTQLMKDFNKTSGYDDLFLPAMKQLSPLYFAYHQQAEEANTAFLEKHPEFKNLE